MDVGIIIVGAYLYTMIMLSIGYYLGYKDGKVRYK